jgi:hypothetical protein
VKAWCILFGVSKNLTVLFSKCEKNPKVLTFCLALFIFCTLCLHLRKYRLGMVLVDIWVVLLEIFLITMSLVLLHFSLAFVTSLLSVRCLFVQAVKDKLGTPLVGFAAFESVSHGPILVVFSNIGLGDAISASLATDLLSLDGVSMLEVAGSAARIVLVTFFNPCALC